MKPVKDNGKVDFMKGVALVIGSLVREYDHTSIAAGILTGYGIRLEEFKGVDPFDMKHIRKLYRDEHQLQGLKLKPGKEKRQ